MNPLDGPSGSRIATTTARFLLVSATMITAFNAHSGDESQPLASSALTEQLEQAGWRLETGEDGSRYYHPAPITEAPAMTTSRATADEPAASAESTGELEHLLRQRGWRIDRDVDGNTLLIRTTPTGVADRQPGSDPAPLTMHLPDTERRQETSESDPVDRFSQALEAKGWTVTRDYDGTLTLSPPGSALPKPEAEETSREAAQLREARGYCRGIDSIARALNVGENEILDEDRAGALTAEWIRQHGRPDSTAGRIRQINRIFVVSVVATDPPHALHNQLVIHQDGRVLALY